MPKSTAMKDEIDALKKKRDAGTITAFKFRQGLRRIKKKYGADAPSNFKKLLDRLLTASPGSAKAVASERAAAKAARTPTAAGAAAKRMPTAKKKSGMATPTPPPAGRKKKSTAVPTPPPKGRKTPKKEKLYTAINVNTGKPDFSKPKVTAAERLKQEDKYKKRQAAQKNVDKILKNLRGKKGKK
tara:strand:- start:707 stop:1261 length:555 start_codon:yes stop_codon:yes gene_type:complete